MGENLLGVTTWREEASAVINDIKKHVNEAVVSETLSTSTQTIFINLKTLEDKPYCVEMTAHGLRVVGNNYDTADITTGEYFETPYSLLDKISEAYRKSFGGELMNRLLKLAKESETEE